MLVLGLVGGALAGFMVGFLARGSVETGASGPGGEAAASEVESPIVLRVGDATLTRAQFEARWKALGASGRAFLDRRGGRAEFLEEIADELALAAEARALGLDRDPAVAELTRSAVNRVIARPLLAREVRAAVVPESELRAYHEAHRNEFARPARVELSEIVVTSAAGSGPRDDSPDALAARAKAERLRAAVLAGEDFAAVARRASEAPSAPSGGYLGWVSPGGLPPAYEALLPTLEPGQVSEIVEIPEGLAILRAGQRTEASEPTFDEVRDDLLERLLADDPEALQRRYRAYVSQLRTRLGTTLNTEALGATAPAAQAATPPLEQGATAPTAPATTVPVEQAPAPAAP